MKAVYRFTVVFVLFALLLASCAPAATTVPAEPTQAEAAQGAETAPTEVTEAEPTKAPEAEQPAAEAPAEPVTISMWVESFGDGTTADCIVEQGVTAYNESNTSGITVEAVVQPNNWDAVRTAVSGGGGPDIVITPGPSFVYEMANAGLLIPLDAYAEKLGWADQFAPWALSLGKVNGDLYSIPHEIEALVLIYNKTLFEEHGWKAPKTMDEFFTLMEEIKAAGIIPNAAGNAEWRATNEWYQGEFFNAVAGPENVYKALKGEKPWTDPEFVESVDKLNEAMQAGYWQGGLELYYTAKGDEINAQLGAGESAMMFTGSWSLGEMNRYFGEEAGNTNEWDWVPVPTKSGKPSFSLGIGSTYSINSASQNPEAAAEYLTYYFSPETQGRMMSKCGVASAPINITEKELEGVDARQVDFIVQMSQAAKENSIGYTTWTFWPPKSDVYIYEEIEKVWAGQMTTQEYLEGLDKVFQEELAAGEIPPIPER